MISRTEITQRLPIDMDLSRRNDRRAERFQFLPTIPRAHDELGTGFNLLRLCLARIVMR